MIRIRQTKVVAGERSTAVKCPSCKDLMVFQGSTVPTRCTYCKGFLPNFMVLSLKHPVLRRIEYYLTGGILGAKVEV